MCIFNSSLTVDSKDKTQQNNQEEKEQQLTF